MRRSRSLFIAVGLVLAVSLARAEMPRSMYSDDRLSFWAGPGYMGGDVTYQIGGHVSGDLGEGELPFPISELKWPLNQSVYTVGGEFFPVYNWQVRGSFSQNLDSESGKIEDSDWTNTSDPFTKTIYSESDTEGNATSGDVGVRYWFGERQLRRPDKKLLRYGVGGGYTFQRFEWKARDLDQWYPQDPSQPHDRVSGLVGTYKADVDMLYADAAGRLTWQQLRVDASLGIAPVVLIHDEDDHILRTKRSETDATGYGLRTALSGSYDFACGLFLTTRASLTYLDTEGRDKSWFYAGQDKGTTWSIDHKITSLQYDILLLLGLRL